jgi:hypothetical protein
MFPVMLSPVSLSETLLPLDEMVSEPAVFTSTPPWITAFLDETPSLTSSAT